MSYKEKQAVLTMVSQLAILACYCAVAAGQIRSGDASLDDMKFWAVLMLVFIGIGIAATIVIQILFHILLSIGTAVKTQIVTGGVDEKELERSIKQEMVEDERDKLIGLKSSQVGYIVAGVGFVTGLLTLVAGYAPGIMLNAAYLSFAGGAVLEAAAQLFFYRRGVRNV